MRKISTQQIYLMYDTDEQLNTFHQTNVPQSAYVLMIDFDYIFAWNVPLPIELAEN